MRQWTTLKDNDVMKDSYEISTTGIEVDSSTGNLVVEGAVVVTLLVIVCAVYAFKKWIDTWLK